MSRFSAVGLVLFVAACAPKELKFDINIVTKVCDPAVDPFKSVSHLKVRVLGPDITKPIESTSPTNGASHDIHIPNIPAGKSRVVEVRGYQGDPGAGGQLVSIGKSQPFEVYDVVPTEQANTPTKITIFLRTVGAFTPVSSAADPTTCQTMKSARAGHTATVLKDGRVFIAGGYELQGQTIRDALAQTEMFDPSTGTFATFHPITASRGLQELPRAFHTATLLPSGQVLFWGGETYNGTAANVISPSAILLIFDADDPNGFFFGTLPSRHAPSPASIPRSQHSAVLDANGKVLIVGGITRDQSALVTIPELEYFDPATNDYEIVDGVSLARVGANVAAVQQGTYIAVAGGDDGTTMQPDVNFFRWNGTTFNHQTTMTLQLAPPGRRGAAGAVVAGTDQLLLLGGYSDPGEATPVQTSELVNSNTGQVAPGATIPARGESCAVTLANGDVFLVGGRGLDGSMNPVSLDSTLTIQVAASGGTQANPGPALNRARYQHTCSLLQDGTVLVTGGLDLEPGSQTILSDAYIYQPPPTD